MSQYKLLLWIVKYIPFILVVATLIKIISIYIFNYPNQIIEFIFSTSIQSNCILYILSLVLKFCNLHINLIKYLIIVNFVDLFHNTICINYYNFILFILFVLGSYLCIILILFLNKNEYNRR